MSDTNTNLPIDNQFYFGSAPGEAGNSTSDAAVNVFDVLATRHNLSTSSVGVTNQYDFNRDGAVNTSDLLFVRSHQTDGSNLLNLINPPPVAAANLVAKSRPITNPYKLKLDLAAVGVGQIVTTSTTASTSSTAVKPAIATATLYTIPLSSALPVADVIQAAEILTSNPLPQDSSKHREPLALTAVARPAQHPVHKVLKHPVVHHLVTHAASKNKPPFSEVKVELQPAGINSTAAL